MVGAADVADDSAMKKAKLEALFERWKQRQIEDANRGGLRWTVQTTIPVDNPVNNVRMKRGHRCFHFEVPINHPFCPHMGLSQLIDAAHNSDLSALSTPLNTEIASEETPPSMEA